MLLSLSKILKYNKKNDKMKKTTNYMYNIKKSAMNSPCYTSEVFKQTVPCHTWC